MNDIVMIISGGTGRGVKVGRKARKRRIEESHLKNQHKQQRQSDVADPDQIDFFVSEKPVREHGQNESGGPSVRHVHFVLGRPQAGSHVGQFRLPFLQLFERDP